MTGPYRLPDYTTLVNDADQYCNAWQNMAKPVEQAMGLTLTAFDPDFLFTKGNPNGMPVSISLPLWFVRDLNKAIGAK